MKQAETFATRLRRFIMGDVDHNLHRKTKFRVDVIASVGAVDTDTVRYWALGQQEPTAQQRDLCDIAIRSSEMLSRRKK